MEDNVEEKKTILVVDDDPMILNMVVFNLQREGYNILEAYDGEQAVNIALEKRPDLILLDIMLPKMNGKQACVKIRYLLPHVPILMLTALSDDNDKIIGLELGADDYITKPFEVREVIARVKAHLRKAEIYNKMDDKKQGIPENNIITLGDLTADLEKFELKVNGKIIDLTKREFEFLKYLIQHPGQVITREMILKDVWKYENGTDDNTRIINVTVRRIREKIEKDQSNPRILLTKRGVGYYIAT